MKKYISIILTFSVFISLCACGTASKTDGTSATPTPTAETVSPEPTEVDLSTTSDSEWEDLASTWFQARSGSGLKRACPDNDVHSVGHISVGSTDVEKEKTNVVVTKRGTFYGYDKFGSVVDEYKFTFKCTFTYLSGKLNEDFDFSVMRG